MAPTRTLMTADQLAALPDDGQRHELVAGELRTMSPSGGGHGRLAARFTISLGQHVQAHHLGEVLAAETGFLLATGPDTVRAPDVAFVSRERLGAVGHVTGYWPVAPDLVVEVVSPNDRNTEVNEKVVTWLEHGTRMVIVADPRHHTVEVHRSATEVRHLTIEDTLDGEDVVPGWTVLVRDLFATGG